MADSPIDELFRRFQRSRNADDLGRVFDLAAPELMAMARRSGLEPAAREDALQETFLTVLRRIEDFEPGARFMPWAQGIMARQIQSERRKVQRFLGALGLEELPPVPHSERGPGQLMEDKELRARVEEALERVSSSSQSVLRGTLLRGETTGELAQQLGITSNAVSVRVHRGLEQIRSFLPAGTLVGLAASILHRQRGLGAVRSAVGSALEESGRGLSLLTPLGWCVGAAGLVAATVLGVNFAMRAAPAEVELESPGAAFERTAVEGLSDAAAPRVNTGGREAVSVAQESPAAGMNEAGASAATVPDEPAPTPRTVQLLEPSGRPAPAGIEVFALATTPGLELPAADTTGPMGVTDESGQVRWLTGAADGDPTPLFYAKSARWAGVLSVEEASEDQDLTLPLEPGLTLDVRVSDPDGTPIAGAEVSLLSLHPSLFVMGNPHALERGFFSPEPYRHLFGGVTDANGQCTILGFLTESVSGRPAATVMATKEGYASFPMRFYWEDDRDRRAVELVAPRVDELKLFGRALDGEGAPLEGVSLQVEYRGNETDEGREIAVTGPTGEWELEPRYLDRFPMLITFKRSGHVVNGMRVAAPGQIDGEPLDIRLRRHSPLTGFVRDAGGQPVAATLRVISSGDVGEAETDEDGAFRFAGGPSRAGTLEVTSSAEPLACTTVSFPNHEEPLEIRLAPAAAAAAEILFHADEAEAGTEGRIEALALIPRYAGGAPENPAGPLPLTRWPFVDVADGPTFGDPAAGSEGGATCGETAAAHGLPEGEWTVLALLREGDQRRPAVKNLTVRPSDVSSTVRLRALETGSLGISVTAGPGVDLSDALVTATRFDNAILPLWFQLTNELAGHEIQSPLDPSGALEADQLLAGTWTVHVSGVGWATPISQVDVLPGTHAQLDLEAELAGTMKLRLPPIKGPGRFTVEVSPTADGPFRAVSMKRFLAPLDEVLPVALPPGKWFWRVHCSVFPTDDAIGIAIPSAQGSRRIRRERSTTISPFRAKRSR